jgi:hypothetical protein
MVGEVQAPLEHLGVVDSTIRVFSKDRQTEYQGPTSDQPDFLVVSGDQSTPSEIVRNPDGAIDNGEEVSVDYQHDENFTLEYTYNKLVEDVQHNIEENRHATADVLAKHSVPHPVEIEATVIVEPNASISEVEKSVRSNLSNELNLVDIGQNVYQSDVIQAIDSVDGVRYVVDDLSRMARQDGTLLVREKLNTETELIQTSPQTKIVALQDRLRAPTIDRGGHPPHHKGVFRNGSQLEQADRYKDLTSTSPQSYIIGDEGLVIEGYTDGDTLRSDGFDGDDIEEERRRRTANRVFLSLPPNQSIDEDTIEVSYHAYGETGANDITVSNISHVELGDLTLTPRKEDQS